MSLERKVRFQLWFMQSAVFRVASWFLSFGVPRHQGFRKFRENADSLDDEPKQ